MQRGSIKSIRRYIGQEQLAERGRKTETRRGMQNKSVEIKSATTKLIFNAPKENRRRRCNGRN